jgi:transposase
MLALVSRPSAEYLRTMTQNKRRSEAKNKAFVVRSNPRPVVSRAQADQLQKELDHLALLLDQVKRQTEKVEAAADAIGDVLIGQLSVVAEGQDSQKPGSELNAKTNSRPRALRSLPTPIRPQDLERAQG